MMENETSSYFYFTLFNGQGKIKYVFFILVLLLYLTIVFFNTFVIAAIVLDTSLHKPMYILISCLSANALYGSLGLFHRLLIDLHSDIHTILYPACFIQIFIIYTYASYDFTLLTAVAYDRYIAICRPLQYHKIMTSKSLVFIACAFIYPVVDFQTTFMWQQDSETLLQQLGSCLFVLCNHHSVWIFYYCHNNFYSIFIYFVYICTHSYHLSKNSSALQKQKALHTCLPHIVSFVNYSTAMFCEIAFSRYEPGELNEIVAIILSLEFLITPPVLNPLVYALSLPAIHRKMYRVACCTSL